MSPAQKDLRDALKLKGDACVEAITSALRAGADPNFHYPTMGEGETPLHIACSRERVEAIRTLIELGANPRELDCEHRTPAGYSLRNDWRSALRGLAAAGVDLREEPTGTYTSLLHQALQDGAHESVPVLLDAGIDPCVVDPRNGRSAVYLAATYPAVISEFSSRGFDLDGVNQTNGETLAHAVARTEIEECWLAILESRAQLDIRNRSDQTALDLALQESSPLRDLTLAWQARQAAHEAISGLEASPVGRKP